MTRSEEDFNNFLNRFPELSFWKGRKDSRLSPRDKNRSRLENEFSISDFSKLITSRNIDENESRKILFAHFSPFVWELEGIGLPSFYKKIFPNSIVHFTYDKGLRESFKFKIDGAGVILKS